jgi:hypothetical protein
LFVKAHANPISPHPTPEKKLNLHRSGGRDGMLLFLAFFGLASHIGEKKILCVVTRRHAPDLKPWRLFNLEFGGFMLMICFCIYK